MKLWLILILMALPCQAARNPFVPLADPCLSPFEGWTLRGVTLGEHAPALALVSTPGGWVRLQSGVWPQPGWQVDEITDAAVRMRAQTACAPVVIHRSER